MTWGLFIILMIGMGSVGIMCLALAAPSPHRFQPDPLKPRECRICGRREAVHQVDA